MQNALELCRASLVSQAGRDAGTLVSFSFRRKRFLTNISPDFSFFAGHVFIYFIIEFRK